MYKWYCRLYQFVYRLVANLVSFRKPILIEGKDSLFELPGVIKSHEISKVLIVTDQGIARLGLMKDMLIELEKENIDYFVFDETIPNPTIDNVEKALRMYKGHQCQAIIAFGGGSPIDCAKVIGARIAKPQKPIQKMKGQLKIRKELPLLVAVPTTAGTGSEATVAAVISNPETNDKFPINDPVLIPKYAVLDPILTLNLPPHLTSTTGMDALTHAVEAYIGQSNTKETRESSRIAVKLIFDNLFEAYENGSNLNARKNMQNASYHAGVAFTRAYVGYVHAIAHTLGGFYSIPHGLANAIILPYVLEYYGSSVHKQLAELADLVGISKENETKEQKSQKFIEAVRKLNSDMKIPTKISGIMAEDIPLLVERAYREANPLYPVPRIFSREDLLYLYQVIME